jgi:hypothetical protein
VIYYQVTQTALIIVRVVHGKRDTFAMFEPEQDEPPRR